jgi:Flp pilus assembly protein TadD
MSDTAKSSKAESSRPDLAKSFAEAVGRGDEAWRSGQADIALYLYVQALSFKPRDITTLKKLAAIEQSRGNLPLAAQALLLAANAEPTDTELTARLGLIYLTLGDDENAMKWLRSSVDNGSTDWHVYDGMGVALQRTGDISAALSYLEQAVRLAPGKPVPLLHQGAARLKLGDYGGAETALHDSLSAGSMPDAWRLLGEVQAKQRHYSDAIQSYLHALDGAEAYKTTGQIALANEDNAIALRYFEKASAESPAYLQDVARSSAIAREKMARQ